MTDHGQSAHDGNELDTKFDKKGPIAVNPLRAMMVSSAFRQINGSSSWLRITSSSFVALSVRRSWAGTAIKFPQSTEGAALSCRPESYPYAHIAGPVANIWQRRPPPIEACGVFENPAFAGNFSIMFRLVLLLPSSRQVACPARPVTAGNTSSY